MIILWGQAFEMGGRASVIETMRIIKRPPLDQLKRSPTKQGADQEAEA